MPHQVPVVTTVPARTVAPCAWRGAARPAAARPGRPSNGCRGTRSPAASPIVHAAALARAQSRGANGSHAPSTSAPCDCRSASLASGGAVQAFGPARIDDLDRDRTSRRPARCAPAWSSVRRARHRRRAPGAARSRPRCRAVEGPAARVGRAGPDAGSAAAAHASARASRDGPPDFQCAAAPSPPRTSRARAATPSCTA